MPRLPRAEEAVTAVDWSKFAKKLDEEERDPGENECGVCGYANFPHYFVRFGGRQLCFGCVGDRLRRLQTLQQQVGLFDGLAVDELSYDCKSSPDDKYGPSVTVTAALLWHDTALPEFTVEIETTEDYVRLADALGYNEFGYVGDHYVCDRTMEEFLDGYCGDPGNLDAADLLWLVNLAIQQKETGDLFNLLTVGALTAALRG